MAVSTTVSYPSGVNAAVRQRDTVTITITGLTANTNYVALWNRPGSSIGERVANSDGTGTIILYDNPQVSGTHTFQLATTLDTFIPGAPTMSAVELKPAAVTGATATYTVG
jgi:hypothetical protein